MFPKQGWRKILLQLFLSPFVRQEPSFFVFIYLKETKEEDEAAAWAETKCLQSDEIWVSQFLTDHLSN